MVAYGRWSLTRSGRWERVDCSLGFEEKWNTWKAALRADVRSFLAEEPNTPRAEVDEDGRNEDFEEDFDEEDDAEDEYWEDESGVEYCAPLLSLTWVSCA